MEKLRRRILTRSMLALLCFPLGMAAIIGCTAETEGAKSAGGAIDLPVELSVGIGQKAKTRAGTALLSSVFDVGDKFYAYFPGSKVTKNNTLFTIQSAVSQAKPDAQPFVKKAYQGTATVQAYYPQTVTETTAEFEVKADQSSTANYKASDLLYATNTIGLDGKATLNFDHRLSKIIVKATAGMGVTSITAVNIISGNRKVNLTAGTAMPGATLSVPNSSGSPLVMYSGTGTEAICAALIPPQTIANTAAFIEIVTNLGKAWYSLVSTTALTGGKSYTYELFAGSQNIGLTTTVTDWLVGDSFTGEVDIK